MKHSRWSTSNHSPRGAVALRLLVGVLALGALAVVAIPALTQTSQAEDCPPIAAPGGAIANNAVIRALEAGNPIPSGACRIEFPWMGKQSVMCVGDSVERQIAFVDFSGDADAMPDSGLLGSVDVDARGGATGTFTVPAVLLRSGDKSRNEKLQGGAWLDAESHPNLDLRLIRAQRVGRTVWDIYGEWTMRGVTHPVSILANVQHIPEMQFLGKNLARVKGSFFIDLKRHEILNDAVGTPAVAQKWLVDVVLLGKIMPAAEKKPENAAGGRATKEAPKNGDKKPEDAKSVEDKPEEDKPKEEVVDEPAPEEPKK